MVDSHQSTHVLAALDGGDREARVDGTTVDTHQATVVASIVSTCVLTSTFHVAQRAARHVADHGTEVVGVGVELGADHHVLDVGIGISAAKHTHIRSGDGATETLHHMAITFEGTVIQSRLVANRHPDVCGHVDIGSQGEVGIGLRCAVVLTVDDGNGPSQLLRCMNVLQLSLSEVIRITFGFSAFKVRIPSHSGDPGTQPVEVVGAITIFRGNITLQFEDVAVMNNHRLCVVRIVEIGQRTSFGIRYRHIAIVSVIPVVLGDTNLSLALITGR